MSTPNALMIEFPPFRENDGEPVGACSAMLEAWSMAANWEGREIPAVPAKRAMREGEEEAIMAALGVWRETGVWDGTGLPEQEPLTEEEVQASCAYLKELMGRFPFSLVQPPETGEGALEMGLYLRVIEALEGLREKTFQDAGDGVGMTMEQQGTKLFATLLIQLCVPHGEGGGPAEEGEDEIPLVRSAAGEVEGGADEIHFKKGLVGHEAGSVPGPDGEGQPE